MFTGKTITKSEILRKLMALLIVLLAVNSAQAQWPFELWHEGKIVLTTGDTLKGLIKYDFQQDLVQYSLKDEKPEVFTARKILFFEIFEEAIHKYRRFFVLPFTTSAGYKTPIFFELLEEGKMTLLSREFLEYKTYSSPYFLGAYSRLVMSYKYFFLKEDGSIEEFSGNRNDLLALMGKKSDDIEKFMKNNHLRPDEKQDLTQIIDYYNSLFGI